MKQSAITPTGLLKVSSLALALAMAFGCAPGTSGRYVQAVLPAGAPTDATPSIVGGMELTLESNGNYRMTGFPATKGTWKEEGEVLTLTPEDGAPYRLEKRGSDRYEQVEPKRSVPTFWIRAPKT